MKRFIVCGGPDYTDWIAVFYWLNRLDEKLAVYTGEGDERKRTPGIAEVVVCGADPFDEVVKEWAEVFGRASRVINARDPVRDFEGAHGLVVFPGLQNTDSIRRARAARIVVWEPEA